MMQPWFDQYTNMLPIQMAAAAKYYGHGIQTESRLEGGQDVAFVNNGDWTGYNGVDFGVSTLSLSARVASPASGGTINVRLGTTNGPLVGVLTVPNTGGWQTWTTVNTTLTNVSGVQNLVLQFAGAGTGYLFNVEWLELTPVSASPARLGWKLNVRLLQFDWPADHIGWRLEVQTNTLDTGLGRNWVTVPSSTATNIISIPVNNGNGSIFFRPV